MTKSLIEQELEKRKYLFKGEINSAIQITLKEAEKRIDELKTPDDYTEEEIAIYAYVILDCKKILHDALE